MATHKSAEKAFRQSIKRNKLNSIVRTKVKSAIKRVTKLLSTDLKNEEARSKILNELKNVEKVLKKAASKGVIHKNTASRKISRLHHAVRKALNA